MIINHNISSLSSLNNFKNRLGKLTSSIEKLSSGLRINRAADDSAGLAISEKMRGQIRGLEQAKRNIQDGISLLQTADGGLSQIIDPPLQRLRELAVYAANDTLNVEDRMKIQDEIQQIKQTIEGIVKETKFNGIPLLSTDINVTSKVISQSNSYRGTRVNLSTSLGSTPEETVANLISNFQELKDGKIGDTKSAKIAQDWTLSQPSPNEIQLTNNSGQGYFLGFNSPDGNIEYLKEGDNIFIIKKVPNGIGEDLFGAYQISDDENLSGRNDLVFSFFSPNSTILTLQTGPNKNNCFSIEIKDMSIKSLEIQGITVLSSREANEAIQAVDFAIEKALKERSKFGAYQNRLEYKINNLKGYSENLTAAESRIRDVDMAKELMDQTQNSILAQVSQAMLAQANQLPQGVLQLLR